MVWRAKVRDHDRFFSPLGLESEGIAVDFQVGVNDYLYGTRFFSYLALTYGPEKAVDWLRRPEDSKAFYAARFKQVFGRRLDDVWDDWIALRAGVPAGEPRQARAISADRDAAAQPARASARSRAASSIPKTNSLIAAFRYPGTIGFVGRLDLATGKLTKLQEIKGMMLYKVTSLAFDPDARTAYYTEDNYAFRDIIAVNVDTGSKRMLLKDARIGDIVLNPRRQVAVGHPPPERLCDHRPDPGALHRASTRSTRSNTARSRSTSTSRPTASLISASFGEVERQPDGARVAARFAASATAIRGSRAAVAAAVDARRLHLRARRQDDVRHVLLYRRVERLPLRHRHRQI